MENSIVITFQKLKIFNLFSDCHTVNKLHSSCEEYVIIILL